MAGRVGISISSFYKMSSQEIISITDWTRKRKLKVTLRRTKNHVISILQKGKKDGGNEWAKFSLAIAGDQWKVSWVMNQEFIAFIFLVIWV